MIRFPFVAIVGMELAKKSLIYHAIDPRIGGVLLLGHRGCAKTTLARACTDLFSNDESGNAAPFVEVPLGATEDRLLGSVDAEALVEGNRWSRKHGLLEQAHGGILYVDEINLLPDHLSDLLLDSAATGYHRVERDGISYEMESRYVLVGTMNPDEGDLRPQLADRFAHEVRIEARFTPAERVEIVSRRIRFEDEPESFRQSFGEETRALRGRISEARKVVRKIRIPEVQRQAVGHRAAQMELEGMRTELAVLRTARCVAAFAGRLELTAEDLAEAWELCLRHRAEPPPAQQTAPPTSATTPQRPAAPDNHSNQNNNGQLHPVPTTPLLPTDAHRQELRLAPLPPVAAAAAGLRAWYTKEAVGARRPRRSEARRATATADPAPISWIATLVATVIRTGLNGQRRVWVLRKRPRRRRPAIWLFLDASRSTGVGNFLRRACVNLISLLQARESRGLRFYVLAMQSSVPRWLVRAGSAARARAALDTLRHTAGKSFLTDALNVLRRVQVRQRGAHGDGLLICSDGFLTPRTGDSPMQAIQRLQHLLKRLSEARRIAWVHPRAKRSAASWLARLTAGCQVDLYEF
ncbi:MAG: sigma 54-interacting transcriptional regulator [Verrucomicrobia bacterium]|nr:sigma 54-interacting transcriptional regulator [Verrucomicrobiota bacterium]